MSVLSVGDTVDSPFGPAAVENIELVENGSKYGLDIPHIYWSLKEHIVVSLSNGHWAYGSQLKTQTPEN